LRHSSVRPSGSPAKVFSSSRSKTEPGAATLENMVAHDRTFQYNEDEKRFTEELNRLIGRTWEHAAKLP
jgi:hypothetical protein